MDYKAVAGQVVDAVGGKENVVNLVHCITRLRFTLKDNTIPDRQKIARIEGVLQVIEQNGQFQVVIGASVAKVYDECIKLLDLKDDSGVEIKQKKSILDKFIYNISGIMMPILGIMAASGLIKGLIAILGVCGVLTTTMSTYTVLYAISNTIFYFMPIILGASAAKHFKINSYVGMIIGGAMIYPTIVTAASSATKFTFLLIPMKVADYTSTVFPVIIAVWFASFIYKKMEKITPSVVSFFLVPSVTMLISVPVTLFVIGPVINFLSSVLATGVMAVYHFSPILSGLVVGGLWILIVTFGLHWAFIPLFVNDLTTLGYSVVMGLLFANLFAAGGTLLAVALKSKNKKTKALAASSAVSNFLGVMEPGIYGILLPIKKALYSTIVAASIGSAIAGAVGTRVYGVGLSGIFQASLWISPTGIDFTFIGGVIAAVVSTILGFVFTMIFVKENDLEQTDIKA